MIRGRTRPLMPSSRDTISHSSGSGRLVTISQCRADQKLTKSLIAVSAFDGTTLRFTKSSQFLNFSLVRASMIALARAGPICGRPSSSAALAVLRLTFLATGVVAAGAAIAGAAGLAGVVAGAGVAGGGCF